jgi:predicted DsbA family dithiol-disulfide isomerase
MAIESPRVRSDCISAQEFPDLSQRYQVQSVPRTVANDAHAFDGAAPEAMFLEFVQKAMGIEPPATDADAPGGD